ncbi:unnamed protein product, partial [marine sediment metagenome]
SGESQEANLTFPTNLVLLSYDYLVAQLAHLGHCLGSLSKLLLR